MTLERRARPKVNLTLEITGRRDDGYHLLESLVVFAEGGDRLIFESSGSLSLTCDGPFAGQLPATEENLVMKAARGLAALAPGSAGGRAAIHLQKNLPAAGGIGGGSADAAAALDGLVELWGLRPDPRALYDLALSVGADLPVCLNGKPCLMRGIGEELEAAPALPQAALLLVNPGTALSTPEVFKAREGSFSTPKPWPERFDSFEQFVEALAIRSNDLEPPARGLQPVVGEVLAALEALPGCRLARLSGSGPTCFGLFTSLGEAEDAAAALALRHPGWWRLASTVSD